MSSIEPAISQTPHQRLPNLRECHTETLAVDGQSFEATVGFDPKSGQPREVFLNGGKEGSQVDAMFSDAATVLSVALQFGVPVAAFAKSVGRGPDTSTTPRSLDQFNAGNRPA